MEKELKVMADDDNRNNKDGYDPDRRKFLKNTGILAGGVVGGSVLGGLLTSQFLPKQETIEQAETITELQNARVFFDRKEDFEVLSAATERIFPKDDNGPGAIELDVPYFIDKQRSEERRVGKECSSRSQPEHRRR